MASSSSSSTFLHQNPTITFLKPPSSSRRRFLSVVRSGAGPRSHRTPLVKGRILSIEAIQAVQTLKRQTNNPNLISNTLTRLIKSDLIAAFKELLRQDHSSLALLAFSAVRSEYAADLFLYAQIIQSLAKNNSPEDIDRLIVELEESNGGKIDCEDKGLVDLIKAVVAAGRKESTVRIYGMMKMSGWGSSVEADEYVAGVLSKGFKNFGEEGLALEVESEYKKSFVRFSRGKLDISIV